jgi:hypothetical protein
MDYSVYHYESKTLDSDISVIFITTHDCYSILFEEENVSRDCDVSMGRYAERMPNVIRGCSSVQYLLVRRDAEGGVWCRRRRYCMRGCRSKGRAG